MLRILFAIPAGLFGAALLHLVIILALPHFTGQDAYTKVASEGEMNRFYALGARPDAAGLASRDPYVKTAVCSFDLAEKPVHFQAKGHVPFWSIAIYDRASNEVFSMNDRTSVGGMLDVLAATPGQLTRLRKSLPVSLQQTILVEMAVSDGYAVLRSLAPQPSFGPSAQDFLAGADCSEFSSL